MELIPFAESVRIITEYAGSLKPTPEGISTRAAIGRVLYNAVSAKRSHPNEPIAAMDGIAVDFRATSTLPARLKARQWEKINTGERLKDPFNAVVKIEDVRWEGETPVLNAVVYFYQNIRRQGEDFETGQLLLPAGHVLRPQDLSLLLSAGYEEIIVNKKPVVTFLPTGSELVISLAQLKEGQVLESNSAMIKGLIETWGGEFRMTDPIPDDPDDLAQVIKISLTGSNLLIISAGTSMGSHDHTADVLRMMGKIHFHGVAVNPARPVLFADINQIPVLGLPGYPAAAFLAASLYVRQLVCAQSGLEFTPSQSVFISAEDLAAKNADYFYRVNLFEVDGQIFVRRIAKGAGSTLSLSQMDGLMHVPPNTPIRMRDAVRVDVVTDRSKNAIAVRGEYDSDVSYLFDLVQKEMPSHRFLFWETDAEEALQNIIERNAHIAIISTPVKGPDLFPQFAGQLQEPMLRLRLFTRSVGLILPRQADLAILPKPLTVGLPDKNQRLWEEFLQETKAPENAYESMRAGNDEQLLAITLSTGHWQSVFADIRFLKADQQSVGLTKEHLDLVVPEEFIELPAIKKLIELLQSEDYRKHLASRNGLEL